MEASSGSESSIEWKRASTFEKVTRRDTTRGRRRSTPSRRPLAKVSPSNCARSCRARRGWLLDHQHADGHWVAELEGDTILESEYLCCWHTLAVTARRWRARRHSTFSRRQLPCGGWTLYPGGGMDISVSVKAYFSLKMTGHDPEARIHAAGPQGDSRQRRRRCGE